MQKGHTRFTQTGTCDQCRTVVEVELWKKDSPVGSLGLCPDCGSPDFELLAGRGVRLVEIEGS